jgi:protein tyrosine/serine phosphatase
LRALPEFFAAMKYPALAHCKSGADRAGLFAALYLLVVERSTVAEARRELSWRKGHFRYAKTGILDAFLEDYAENGEKKGKAFMDWVAEDYDPARLQNDFRPKPLHSFVADAILRRE